MSKYQRMDTRINQKERDEDIQKQQKTHKTNTSLLEITDGEKKTDKPIKATSSRHNET